MLKCNEERLKQIEVRVEKLAPGTWFVDQAQGQCAVVSSGPDGLIIPWSGDRLTEKVFAANARQDVPDLVADVRALGSVAELVRRIEKNRLAFPLNGPASVAPTSGEWREVVTAAEGLRGTEPAVERLKLAIRAFTVDIGTPEKPEPNGPAETAFCRLGEALRALPDPVGRHIAALAAEFCEADANRLQELRLAAEAYFGEGFKRPEASGDPRSLPDGALAAAARRDLGEGSPW